MRAMKRIRVVDSHTGGEPTRIVLAGGPMATRLERFRTSFDSIRSAVVNEPRGSDALVGGLFCESEHPACVGGVIFFNNIGYLGMCGHGTIGLVATLAYLGRITAGTYGIETPPGRVSARLHEDDQELRFDRLEQLTDFTWRIRQALRANGITGAGGKEIDHIELFGPPTTPGADGKNFVLCPGKAYDRSPCGTGTSAKLACLFADGKLRPGQIWRQESIVGSVFEGSVTVEGGEIYPEITGSAFVNGEADLILDERDPFCYGIHGL